MTVLITTSKKIRIKYENVDAIQDNGNKLTLLSAGLIRKSYTKTRIICMQIVGGCMNV